MCPGIYKTAPTIPKGMARAGHWIGSVFLKRALSSEYSGLASPVRYQ